jgi:hypothetical protein
MAGTNVIPDGNAEIAAEIPLIVEIIARTCRWINPETFRQLPVWSPWTARGRPLYDKTWQRRYTNTKRATKRELPGMAPRHGAVPAVARAKQPRWMLTHCSPPPRPSSQPPRRKTL